MIANIQDLPAKGAYVAAIRRAKLFFAEHPAGRIKTDWCTTRTAADFRLWVWDALDNRINSRSGELSTGRAWSQEFEIEERHAQRAIADHRRMRLRFYWLPDHLRARFGHLLARHDD